MNIKISLITEEEPAGYNPEYMALDNPQGIVGWKTAYYIQADINEGELYVHFKAYDLKEDATATIDKIERHLDAGGELDLEKWFFNRYCYGSKAYQRNYEEAEYALLDSDERWNKYRHT